MPRYYVFETQAQAQACADRIWGRLKASCVAQGYSLDPTTGSVIGKDGAGRDVPDALTSSWDIPRQRRDGRWVVRHAAAVPGRSFVLSPQTTPPLTLGTILDADDLTASVTVESDDASWWPIPPLMVARV